MPIHKWEEIVQQIEQEPNPAKVAELAKKLNEVMLTEEKEKVRLRLGIVADRAASRK
jgi:hypothetical protein